MSKSRSINAKAVENALDKMIKENPTYQPFRDEYRKDFYYYVSKYLESLDKDEKVWDYIMQPMEVWCFTILNIYLWLR